MNNPMGLHETINTNTRIIKSLTTLVIGFDYGAYDDNTIPDCMTVISRLTDEARQANDELLQHWQRTAKNKVARD